MRARPSLQPGAVLLRAARRQEAVALLRLFYAQENEGAPVPQKRTRKQLELADGAQQAVRELEEAAAGRGGGGDGGCT